MTQKDSSKRPSLPVAPPSRDDEAPRREGAPDLRIEEIEERHVPKDRNIFDK